MRTGEAERLRKERERPYQYWLHNLPGIGDRTIEKLLKEHGSAKGIYHAGAKALKRIAGEKRAETAAEFTRTWDVEKKYQELADKKILFLPWEDGRYPSRLRKLEHPPYALYCLGSLPKEQAPAAALIGARECSGYGSSMAQAFGGRLAAAGVELISGMARGIDGIGQRAALESGGRTYAVLGSGVDVCYPASNRRLYDEILKTGGGILSPFPPGTQPLKQRFPERNRIVAGMSDLILVVEARLKSGTWITVDLALEQGKSVYAVPGRLTDRLSDGCNFLIRQGAGIALTPEDILEELSVLQNRKGMEKTAGIKNKAVPGKKTEPEGKTESENKTEPEGKTESENKAEPGNSVKPENCRALPFLDEYPRPADEILDAMRKKGILIELPRLFEELVELCLEKKAKQVGGSYFMKVCSGDMPSGDI